MTDREEFERHFEMLIFASIELGKKLDDINPDIEMHIEKLQKEIDVFVEKWGPKDENS